MALSTIQPVQPDNPKPSALENAAKVLGIVGTVGSLAGNIGSKFASVPVNPNPTAQPSQTGYNLGIKY